MYNQNPVASSIKFLVLASQINSINGVNNSGPDIDKTKYQFNSISSDKNIHNAYIILIHRSNTNDRPFFDRYDIHIRSKLYETIWSYTRTPINK